MNQKLISALISNLTSTVLLLQHLVSEIDNVQVNTRLNVAEEPEDYFLDYLVVMEFISEKFKTDLLAPNRKPEVVRVRNILFHLLKKYSRLTTVSIGEKVGNRDHATVIHGIKRVNRDIKSSVNYANYVTDIEKELLQYNKRQAA